VSLPTKVVITGSRGQLASAILRAAPTGISCVPLPREDLDITDFGAVQARFLELAPDCVINGSAYNLVDKAETEGARAAVEINALGVAILARAAREIGARLVHFSTDFVFDGQKRVPYREEDATGPLGVYGASKLCGENIALAGSPRNFAIRVSRLYGPLPQVGTTQKPGGNFPLLMIKLGRERPSLRVVCDQIGSPSYTPDLARATWELLALADGGLFHLANTGEVDFATYAETALEIAGVKCEVERVTTANYGAPAARPLYSTLGCERAWAAGVTPLRPWREALEEFLKSL